MIIQKFLSIIIAALFITCYDPIEAVDTVNAGAQAHVAVDSQLTQADQMQFLKSTILEIVNAQPELYNPADVNELLNDTSNWSAIRYMNQRSLNWRRAAQLAAKNLRWKAQSGLSQATAEMFPCDIFKLGLIFEHGVSNQMIDEATNIPVGGGPVIWLRLGALGNIVKQLEKLTSKRLVSFAYNSARKVTKGGKGFVRKHVLHVPPRTLEKPPLIENMSMRHEQTIQYILKAIAWWLNDWEHRHPPGTKATLVLDFENTDFAFSSWSMGEFFIGLDDHFPDLFEQILGFRYKAKLWSLHSPISMFNRIFKSRISSSPETDSKLKFVQNEPKLSSYITRVDVNGFSMLPDYIYGDCYGPTNQAPAGCQADSSVLVANQLFDPQLLQAISNEFYQVCKPRNRA